MNSIHAAADPRLTLGERVRNIWLFGNPDPLVFFMGIGAVFWGLFLCLPEIMSIFCRATSVCAPSTLWSTFDASRTFSFMASIGAEWKWGVAMTGCSLIKLWALFYTRKHFLKIAANWIMMTIWLFVWVSVILGNAASTGTIVYFFFALASFWCGLRRYMQLSGAE